MKHCVITTHSVRFTSGIPWDRMPEHYQTHDVFLYTSVLDTFGSQLLEAMAGGLPVVTLNHHGAKTYVPSDAAIKVDTGSLEETAAALGVARDRLAERPDLRKTMSAAGWRFAKTQTWPMRVKAMTEIYQRVLNEKL